MSICSVLVAAWFLLLLLAERRWPLRRPQHSWRERLIPNVTLSMLAYGAGALVVRPAVAFVTDFAMGQPVGLLSRLPNSWGTVRFAAGFLTLDFTFYLWHRLNHRWSFLWRFHRVHHIDPDMDVTTTFRFHPVEILLSLALTMAQVVVLGVSPATFLVYGFVFQVATSFHHANVHLPAGLQRVLALFVVTPPMHGIHHSSVIEESGTNFSVVFNGWDRLLGTLNQAVPQDGIRVGVAGFDDAASNRTRALLLDPFGREGARHPAGVPVPGDESGVS